VLLRLRIPTLPGKATKALFSIPLLLVLCVAAALSQKTQQDDGSLPKYDLHTETVIFARELVKGTDTLLFRDDKGKPVWDWRTGK
jgi:hypothetical protein